MSFNDQLILYFAQRVRQLSLSYPPPPNTPRCQHLNSLHDAIEELVDFDSGGFSVEVKTSFSEEHLISEWCKFKEMVLEDYQKASDLDCEERHLSRYENLIQVEHQYPVNFSHDVGILADRDTEAEDSRDKGRDRRRPLSGRKISDCHTWLTIELLSFRNA